ncbi:MAG: hypothetical protein C0444_02780 [Microbacterium sp.]|nr:hypothetical protein [Microbacterium sp.]MBA4346360.1 hypothetical protein [Microbacterium sp.]
MTRSLRATRFAIVASALSLTVLAGCTPTPSPAPSASASSAPEASSSAEPEAPSRPALVDLVLSSEGLGPMLFGVTPETDPALRIVQFDPIACTDAETGFEMGIVAGGEYAGAWLVDPFYELPPTPETNGQPFGISVDEAAGNVLQRVDLYTGDIPTDGGVRIGDDRADVLAGHPSAALVSGGLTDIYVVTGTKGILQIEVATRATPENDSYWGSSGIPDGQVLYIHAVKTSLGVFSVAGSGNIAGGCNFG